ncbi:MAG: hypothetical protein D3924_06570 [Candidatus Electrothrix sp. AR4]|nr:hypothetical protein [Candidatus Electrothrix sp. AR4]
MTVSLSKYSVSQNDVMKTQGKKEQFKTALLLLYLQEYALLDFLESSGRHLLKNCTHKPFSFYLNEAPFLENVSILQ